LSSAILYVAIVAIWACVLIPRWLRRDSSARVSDETATAEETTETDERSAAEADERSVPEPRRRPREARVAQVAHAVPRAVPQVRGGDGGIVRDREHARVLSSRRRLLGLLVLLAVGSAALAVTRMAAWWVLGPPSVMLLGYLALLREASKADAERRELIGARTAHVGGAAGVGGVGGVGGAAGVEKAVPAVPAVPAAPPARLVRVLEAEVIDISVTRGSADGELYDQYADAKLRAVGD
jgi:hypothetical protein